jgi:hypothetical protein
MGPAQAAAQLKQCVLAAALHSFASAQFSTNKNGDLGGYLP